MSFTNVYQNHLQWMNLALDLAKEAGKQGEIPVGAVIVDENNQLLAKANNRKQRDKNAIAHAEILAINQACQQLENFYLTNCILYVTLEPCPMCAGAIIHSRLTTLVYGVDDFKTGCIRTVINIPDSYASNHKLQVIAGIKEAECRKLLKSWFAEKRKKS